MSVQTQVALSLTDTKVLADLDLGIKAVDPTVMGTPWVAGPVTLRATKNVFAFKGTPWVAGAVNLRATKTVLTVG